MPRINAQVEALQRENDLLRQRIARLTEEPPDIPFRGCDNSCVVAAARGMATNGGCRCDEHQLRLAVQYWRRVATLRQAAIQMMLTGEWHPAAQAAASEIRSTSTKGEG